MLTACREHSIVFPCAPAECWALRAARPRALCCALKLRVGHASGRSCVPRCACRSCAPKHFFCALCAERAKL
eukprot:4654418-Alexandrium_andersonii.AAC.1